MRLRRSLGSELIRNGKDQRKSVGYMVIGLTILNESLSHFSFSRSADNWYEYCSLFSSLLFLIESWNFSFLTLNFGDDGTVCL